MISNENESPICKKDLIDYNNTNTTYQKKEQDFMSIIAGTQKQSESDLNNINTRKNDFIIL